MHIINMTVILYRYGMFLSVFFSYYAIDWTLIYDGEEEELEIFPGVAFPLLSFIASVCKLCEFESSSLILFELISELQAHRVLSIFLWKQTLMTIYTRGTSAIWYVMILSCCVLSYFASHSACVCCLAFI